MSSPAGGVPGAGLAARFKGRRGVVLGVGVLAAGYVGWRWYSARNAPAGPAVTSDVGAPVDPSGVIGAPGGGGNVQYAGSTQDSTTPGGPGHFNSNAEWTSYAVEQLSAAGRDPSTVQNALGDFLARRPLDAGEQTIVRAAIAVAGQPPVDGPFTITEQVGSVSLGAPAGVKVASTGRNTVTLTWSPVTGAALYRIHRTDPGHNTVAAQGTTASVVGLTPGHTYRFYVVALTSTGKAGPKSATVSATTKK